MGRRTLNPVLHRDPRYAVYAYGRQMALCKKEDQAYAIANQYYSYLGVHAYVIKL